LVEVVLALGIAAFAIVVIVGLLPVGLKLTRESEDESRAVNILSAIVADRQATPFDLPSRTYGLPALNSTASKEGYFGVKNNEEVDGSDLAGSRFRVSYRITPPPANSLSPWLIWFRVAWPAQASSATTRPTLEKVVAFPQP
jgi:uncharacterized protein (TIGR02598 family)